MKKNKTLRYLLIITALFLVFAIIGKQMGWFGEAYTYKIYTEEVTKRTIVETITANGKIQPETEIKISPDVSGEIVELYVIEGQEIKKGDLLLKIKPDIYLSNSDRMEAMLNSAKAQLAQTEASLIDKENTYNRMKKLWQSKTISDSEYEAAETAYLIAKANVDASKFSVKSSEASLKEARENLSKTTIYSPISGTISKLNIEKGERVVGTAQMAGTELLRIANLYLMEVKVDVNENDIVHVSYGDTALIEVDAYFEDEFKGIVTEIANSANSTGIATDQVTNFEVKIRILPKSYKHLIPENEPNYYPFRPGMSATVDIRTHTALDILAVPIQAVTTRIDTLDKNYENDEKIDEVVFTYVDGEVTKKIVKTGIQDSDYIEITSGLTIDEEVVSAPYNAIAKKLKDKMKVEKVSKENLFNEKE